MLRRRPPQPVRRRAIDRDDSAQPGDLTTASSYAFRRNRTLTGSLLSEISSPSEHRADLKSPRVQAHTLRYRRRKLVLRLFVLLAGIAGLAWILYQSVVLPSVTLVGVDSPSIETTQRYEKAIQDYLAARPFERLRALIDVKSLVDYLQHDYPEIQSVESPLPGLDARNFLSSCAIRLCRGKRVRLSCLSTLAARRFTGMCPSRLSCKSLTVRVFKRRQIRFL